MKYLTLTDHASAVARSQAAADTLPGLPGPGGTALWSLRDLADGRCALVIPDTPEACGIGLSPSAYADLLTSEERAALVDDIPPDLIPPAFP